MTDHTHRWTGDTPRVRPDGTRIEQGEVLSPTDHEQRVWPGRLEALATDSDENDSGGESGGTDAESADGIGSERAAMLREAGIETLADLRASTTNELADAGLPVGVAEDVLADAQSEGDE